MIFSQETQWPKGTVEPIFTTIEIYDTPGVNKYIGLSSNRTVVHKEPETQTVTNYIKRHVNNEKV
jgi:hypothetical protein